MSVPSKSVSLARGVSSTPVEEGLTLLDERHGMIYHLNPTGAVALTALLDGGTEVAVAALCARYATTAPTAHHDVTELLDRLLACRLVVAS
jgi:Coenzyme PQQ synthesis protein D (PqqD)